MLPNVVLFQGLNASDTDSLWETNGTASGTFALTSISGEPAYGFAPYPQLSLDLTVFNNQVLFRGRYTITNYGLWTTDGTAAGTVQLTGIVGANSAGIFTATVSPDFTVYNGEVLFNGRNNASTPAQGLWTTNGTAAGTTEITVNGAASTGVNPSDMAVFNGSVLFNGVDGTVTLSLNGRCRTADRDQKVMRKGLHLSRCSKRSTLRLVHDAFHLQTVDPGDDETGWRSDRGWREISEHAALF